LTLWRRAPYFVDRILKGSAPAVIPVEQASRFTFVVNARSARSMDVSVDRTVLQRADEVID
jgi:putative ABC transport system substrate-binding protein